MTEIDLSLLGDFIVEAREHLEEMESELLKLDEQRDSVEILNNIFRPIHTIKGASQFIGLSKVSVLSHRMEDLLDLCRNGEVEVTDPIIEILIAGRDRIIALVDELERDQVEQSEVEDLVDALTLVIEGDTTAPSPAVDVEAYDDAASAETSTTYSEPADQELFEVFSTQLHEKVALIRAADQRLQFGEDAFTFISLISEAVHDLFNSANYMGYADLAEVYSEWLDLLDLAMQSAMRGNPVAPSLNTRFLDEIATRFPDTAHLTLSPMQLELMMQGDADADEDTDDLIGTLPDELLAAAGLIASSPAGETAPAPEPLSAAPQVQDVSVKNEPSAGLAPELISDEIDLTLLGDFIIEADEHLVEMEDDLLKLSESPETLEILNDIFRPIHTIKGASQFVGVKRVAALSHRLEDLLDLLRQGEITNNQAITELLMQGRDRIVHLIEDLERTQTEETPVNDLIEVVTQVIDSRGLVAAVAPTVANKSESAVLADDGEHIPSSAATTESPASAPEHILASAPSQGVTTSNARQGIQPIVEDEYDSELFGIFITQFRDRMQEVELLLTQMEATGATPQQIAELTDLVGNLRSAANYMGYDEPVAIYDLWLSDLDEAEAALAMGRRPALDIHRARMGVLFGFFPQGEVSMQAPATTAPSVPSPTMASQVSTATPVHAPPVKPTAATPIAAPSAAPAPAPALQKGMDEEGQLYTKLTEALDSSAIPSLEDDYTTLSEVFDEMLSSLPDVSFVHPPADHRPRSAPTAKPSKPTTPASQTSAIRTAVSAKTDEAPAASEHAAASKPTAARALVEPKSAEKSSPSASVEGKRVVENKPNIVDSDESSTEPRESAQAKAKRADGEKIIKKSVRVDADKIDTLMNQVGELIVDRSYFFQLYNEMRGLQQHLKEELGLDQKELKNMRAFTYRLGEAIASLSRTSNELQEGVMKVRMLPISQLFNRYPRLIHDLTHNTDKRVRLDIRGEETELDKMIVEELSDPLIHIIRNSVDHGIETAAERRSSGKDEMATLILEAYQESNHIVIEVTDDGRGLDFTRIRQKAVERGMVKPDEADGLTQRDLVRLIMAPGFSTAATITKTSGRGVGMDVVKKNIEKLNGTIEIESKPGSMTRIRLKIPLTLAIIAALLVRVGRGSFTIPLSNVEETLRIYEADTSTIEGTEVIHLRGRTLPIFRLSNLFNLSADYDQHAGEDKSFVVIVNTGSEQIGLVVDELMGQDEVVIKPLVDYLQERSGFSGATIIGDGRISLILDIYELVNMTASKQVRRLQEFAHRQRYGRKAVEAEEQTAEKSLTAG